MRQYRGTIWALVVVAAGVFGIIYFSRQPDRAPLSHRQIATKVLAEHLKEKHRPTKVLVLANPFSQMSGRPAQVYAFEEAGIEGLRQGFGEGVEVRVVYPELKPEVVKDPRSVPVPAGATTPLSFLLAKGAFNEAIETNKDCEVVVSLIGLPVDLKGVEAWNREGAPLFGLLLPDWRIVGSPQEIAGKIESGKLGAAVVSRPGAPSDLESAGGDGEFERRYLLLTRSSLGSILKEYPKLLLP